MIKEFEEIRDDKLRIGLLGLKRLYESNTKKMTKDEIMAFDFVFINITKALTELKQIKELKPSEAMENLKSLDIQVRFIGILDIPSWKKYLPTIKQALLKAQEQEKVLKVIFEKGVDTVRIRFCNKLIEYYGEGYEKFIVNPLTQEEFDLVKRWVEVLK